MCVITAIPKTALDLYLCMAVDIYIFAISHKILIGVIISSLPLDIGKKIEILETIPHACPSTDSLRGLPTRIRS
jgi:hypothetical protein